MDYSYCGEEVPFNYSNLTTSNPYETRHGTHIITIDFDGTFNASPFIFSRLIRDLKKEGWTVYLVTFRFITQDNVDIEYWRKELDVGVFYTGGVQKAAYLAQFDIYPDIWVDDSPACIPAKNQLEFAMKEIEYKSEARRNGWPFIIEDYPDPEPEKEP